MDQNRYTVVIDLAGISLLIITPCRNSLLPGILATSTVRSRELIFFFLVQYTYTHTNTHTLAHLYMSACVCVCGGVCSRASARFRGRRRRVNKRKRYILDVRLQSRVLNVSFRFLFEFIFTSGSLRTAPSTTSASFKRLKFFPLVFFLVILFFYFLFIFFFHLLLLLLYFPFSL